GVGLCSYLLIGFYFHRKSASDAANKAFIVNRIGDAGFLLGMFTIVWYFGSFRFTVITALARSGQFSIGDPIITAATLLLFVGACGKSAQLPLYVWLPDAMEGPTPVSALIHAATMVTAGVYMVARSNALFLLAPTSMKTVAIVATLTIAGIFPFAGFFSKDEILWQAWRTEGGAYRWLWLVGYGTALMTAFYMFRLMYLTFHGRPRMSHEVEHHIHESPKSMTVPLIILAICAVTAGWLGWPHSLGGSNHFEKFLEPVFARNAPVFQTEGRAGQLAAGEKE